MKRLLLFFSFFFLFILTSGAKSNEVRVAVPDQMNAWNPSNVVINGYLGDKMNLCISQRIKKQDVEHLIEPFRSRNETRLWQTEFWGKWILSAIAAYEYNRDQEMLAIIKKAVSGLLATQTPDGYIGNY